LQKLAKNNEHAHTPMKKNYQFLIGQFRNNVSTMQHKCILIPNYATLTDLYVFV